MATRTSAIRIAVENLDASVAALRQGGEEGRRALERIGVGAQAANQNVERLDKSVGNFARNARSNIIQQAGYQIGDFAVQVQSGTNVVVAATQQLGQLAGAFGVVGAIAGGVISVIGAGIRYYQQTGEESNKAAEELTKLTESTAGYRDILEALKPLQVAFLESLVQGTTAAEAQAAAIAKAKIAAAGGLPGGTPTAGETGIGGAQQGEMLGPETAAQRIARLRASYTAEEQLRIQFIEGRKKEEKGLTDFLINQEIERTKRQNIKGGGVGGISVGTPGAPGFGGASDYLGQAADVQTFTEAQAKLNAQQAKDAAAKAAAAKAAETLHIANEKLLEQAKLKTQAAQEELEALTMGEDGRKRANVERAYELELLAAAQPAQKAVQLALIDEANLRREAALATIEQARALEDVQDQINRGGQTGSMGQFYDTKFAGKSTPNPAVDDPAGYAKKQEDAYTNAWQNIADNVDTITTNMFDDILTKGKVSFDTLAGDIGTMFKTTITGAIGDAVSAPLRDLASGKSSVNWTQLMQGSRGKTAGAGDYLAAAGAGGAGGYAVGAGYGALTGKQDTYAATGGAIGGAVGAAAGVALPGGPLVWGAIGAVAGSFIGGMFGGEGLGNDQSVQRFGSKAAKAIWSDKSFSEENRKITGGIVEQLSGLTEALRASGAAINDISIGIGAGNKTGIAVQGKQYATADEALVGAIKLLLANTGGLQGSQVTALQTTKGRNAQEVMQDLAFAREFDKITFSGTQAEAAMRDLQEQFDATGRKARELGLDEVALGAARERAMAQLTLAVQRQARDLGAQFQMAIATTDLDRSLIGINQQFAGLTDTLTDAGYTAENLAQVEAARVAAESQARSQAAAQAQAEAEARAQQARAEAEQRRQEAERRKQEAIQAAQAREQDRRQRRDFLAQFLGTVTSDPLQQQVIQINNQFAQLRDTMGELGYSAAAYREVEKARIREVAAAYEQARRQTRDFAVQFQQSTSDSELGNALLAIDLEFAHLAESARDAGYSVRSLQDVEKARQRERAQAIEAERRQARGISVSYLTAVTQSPLEKTLLGVNESFDALTDTLKEAGYSSASLAEVEKARVRAQAEAVEQLRLQAVGLQSDLENKIRGIGSFYDDLIRPLEAVNQNSMLNPAGQIGAARTAFQRDLAGAGAQDPEAIRRLAGSAGALQNLVQQNYGTAGIGGQYLREVQGGISGTIAGLQQERAAALSDLPQIVQKTTVDIIRENRADIDRVVEQLELLRRDLRSRGIAA